MSQESDFPFDIEDITHLLNLNIRRRCSDGVYVDCPFCGEHRGKMKVNYIKNVWRCNYCNERGGMLSLYAKMHNLTASEAYREICDSIQNGTGYSYNKTVPQKNITEITDVSRADSFEIHKTLTGLLGMLKLSKPHREHLQTVRGLTDEQIEDLGYKSTPPFYICRQLTERLVEQGYTVKGVPGFYQKDSKWTVNFSTFTAGILIPVRGIDGMIRGFQIRLDVPLKNEDDDIDKPGSKYIWFSSGNKPMGTGSGSPIHFVGDPFARVVYITEGALKADVAHLLMNRTFAALAGINNTAQLDMFFALLAENGTQTIIEAADMDKYRNKHVSKAASAIYLLAKKHGLSFKRLTWNPNYKGIDDWQLAMRCKKERKEEERLTFKKRYLYGLCDFESMDSEVFEWKESSDGTVTLQDYLGLTDREYVLYIEKEYEELKQLILSKQIRQGFRIYQLCFDDSSPTKDYAFSGINELHKAGYEQPPASDYCLVYEGEILCTDSDTDYLILKRIYNTYSDDLPDDYPGRSISPSDVIELYRDNNRKYYYCDTDGFCMVKFSPIMAKQLK